MASVITRSLHLSLSYMGRWVSIGLCSAALLRHVLASHIMPRLVGATGNFGPLTTEATFHCQPASVSSRLATAETTDPLNTGRPKHTGPPPIVLAIESLALLADSTLGICAIIYDPQTEHRVWLSAAVILAIYLLLLLFARVYSANREFPEQASRLQSHSAALCAVQWCCLVVSLLGSPPIRILILKALRQFSILYSSQY